VSAARQNGSAHVIIISGLVVVIIGALAVVFYHNFIAKKDSNPSVTQGLVKTDTPKQKENTITEISGTDMMRYINNDLGFRFDFPKQTYGSSGCHATDKWYDNYGNLVTAPVTSYVVDSGVVDMTVLQTTNRFTIARKNAPQFTVATYGSDARHYNSACKMVDITEDLLATGNVSTDYRSWQVYKIGSLDDIAAKASNLQYVPSGENVASISYSLGAVEDGRQVVTYSVTFKDPTAALTGGSASKTWYYPKQKLLVHIGLGQAYSFQKVTDHDSYYIDQVVESFSVL
jgi:hypothetical protein